MPANATRAESECGSAPRASLLDRSATPPATLRDPCRAERATPTAHARGLGRLRVAPSTWRTAGALPRLSREGARLTKGTHLAENASMFTNWY